MTRRQQKRLRSIYFDWQSGRKFGWWYTLLPDGSEKVKIFKGPKR